MDDILGYLLGLVDSIVSYLGGLIDYIAQFVQYVADVLYGYIAAIVSYLVAGFKIILSFLYHAIDDLIHGRFQDLWNDYLKFRQALQAWLAPLRAAIDQYRKIWHQIYNTYFRPVLQMIGALRKILAVFRVLGFKWAQQLDNYLADAEAKIIGAYQKVLQAINRHADILELLASPLGFLRIVPLIHSAALAAEDLSRLFTGAALKFWVNGAPSTNPPPHVGTPFATYWAFFQDDVTNNTGLVGDLNRHFADSLPIVQSDCGLTS